MPKKTLRTIEAKNIQVLPKPNGISKGRQAPAPKKSQTPTRNLLAKLSQAQQQQVGLITRNQNQQATQLDKKRVPVQSQKAQNSKKKPKAQKSLPTFQSEEPSRNISSEFKNPPQKPVPRQRQGRGRIIGSTDKDLIRDLQEVKDGKVHFDQTEERLSENPEVSLVDLVISNVNNETSFVDGQQVKYLSQDVLHSIHQGNQFQNQCLPFSSETSDKIDQILINTTQTQADLKGVLNQGIQTQQFWNYFTGVCIPRLKQAHLDIAASLQSNSDLELPDPSLSTYFKEQLSLIEKELEVPVEQENYEHILKALKNLPHSIKALSSFFHDYYLLLNEQEIKKFHFYEFHQTDYLLTLKIFQNSYGYIELDIMKVDPNKDECILHLFYSNI